MSPMEAGATLDKAKPSMGYQIRLEFCPAVLLLAIVASVPAGATSETYPAFDLRVTDQVRADAWVTELQQFIQKGDMPKLEIMHLPSDQTAG